MNWVRLYRAMYLKTLNEVSREQRPSLGAKMHRASVALAADRPCLLKAPPPEGPALTHRPRLLTGPAPPSPTNPASCRPRPLGPPAPPALLDDSGHTFDTGHAGGERRDHRCLCLGQRDAHVGCLQGPTVIGSIPAHAHTVPDRKCKYGLSLHRLLGESSLVTEGHLVNR